MKQIKTILLTTDFSETASKAVEPSRMLARKFGAKIIVAHVGALLIPDVSAQSFAVDFARIQEETNAVARRELEQFAAKHFGPDVEVELASLLGIPHVEIVKLARERAVDLIVMATHGRGFISHAFLGSTTERVLRRAPCAVLAIRDFEAS
jgi:nucleotide-binding universal stress UspA family protein